MSGLHSGVPQLGATGEAAFLTVFVCVCVCVCAHVCVCPEMIQDYQEE